MDARAVHRPHKQITGVRLGGTGALGHESMHQVAAETTMAAMAYIKSDELLHGPIDHEAFVNQIHHQINTTTKLL